MPTYDYICSGCGRASELVVPIAERDDQYCDCGEHLTRKLAAPLGRMAGQVTPGGGPDRLTADALGIPVKELPPGLRAGRDRAKG